MSSIQHRNLREIAEDALTMQFGNLEPDILNDLATSVARQWLANDGHAGIVTISQHFWFRFVSKSDGGAEVGHGVNEGRFVDVLHSWNVDESQIPGLLHQLNLRQTADCVNVEGLRLRLRAEPKERRLSVDEINDEETESSI